MDIHDKIISAESSGDLKKANNPNKTSSALGLGQFINGTWLDMIKRYRHDLAKDKSDAEILELRKNADLSKEMTARYAAENGARLRRAGVPVTPTSTYLMHFAGPGGGVKLMKADPNTPVESILDDNAIQANPFLRGKTASWVIAWANKKMADAAPQPKQGGEQWGAGAQPIRSLAQTQAVEPAFGATSWPERPASPNVLSPDAARRIGGAPRTAPIPFVDGTIRAQQALDNSPPTSGAAPWDLSDRFGNWSGLGNVRGPATSGRSGALSRTDGGNGLGASDFAAVQRTTTSGTSGGTSSFPFVRFPLEALLAPEPSRGLNDWASSVRTRSVPSAAQSAANGSLADPIAAAAAIDSTSTDRASAGGLLGLIQDYMRSSGSY